MVETTTEFGEYDALSFDCYGTLIDWETGIAAVIGPWARRFDAALTDEQLLVTYAAEEARVAREQPALPYPDVLAEAFRGVGERLGHPVGDEDAARLGASVPDWPAFGDSHDALMALRRRFKLIILSNVDRESFEGSRRRLGVRFDHVITAQDVGSYKPAQRNFDVLTGYARGEGLRLLHVAQSVFHDHVPARRAGLPGVWINRRHDRPGWGATPDPGLPVTPDWEFPSLAAFAAAAT
ncbi:HAD family hydrolase [Prauserella flavalba]|uniref:Haloacid dehalogenase n=1 Tax=Prauserella flavalba TaxID=1477506 RepID=A0A318LLV9_9PSEU|nr:HAD family hydrolase [Prauserella flavalba]PXY35453.1 haloacid dehalogenase [Prauserella flavalba]